jgi:hypothetical protein
VGESDGRVLDFAAGGVVFDAAAVDAGVEAALVAGDDDAFIPASERLTMRALAWIEISADRYRRIR